MVDSNDLIDLGLAKTCAHFTVESEPTGEAYKVYCPRPVREFGGSCSRHSAERALVDQARVERKAAAVLEKKHMEDVILPKASERIVQILDNDEAKDQDVIKIWQTTMDRIGLAAVQGLMVEGTLNVEAPMDILRRMLTPAPALELDDVVDAVVVDDDRSMLE